MSVDTSEFAALDYIHESCASVRYTPAYDACFSKYLFIWRLWLWYPWIIGCAVILILIVAYLFRSKLETGFVNVVAGIVRWKRRVQSRIAEKSKE